MEPPTITSVWSCKILIRSEPQALSFSEPRNSIQPWPFPRGGLVEPSVRATNTVVHTETATGADIVGPDSVRNRSHHADRTDSALWAGTEAFSGTRRHYHPHSHGCHGINRIQ